MATRKPPYVHADGSNCWTKNCSRRKKENVQKQQFINSLKTKVHNPTLQNNLPPLSAFKKAHAEGRIDSSRHPVFPYVTYKYSRETQFNADWDEVTLASRGIIFNEETGEVVARPFAKFFNYNEPSVPKDQLKGKISVTDKLDGSLGIGYVGEDGKMYVATAGSFKSEQAAHATKIYNERYDGKWNPNPKLTYLWEIIYPENRVVVDYGDEDDLFLIGAVNKRTGRSVPLNQLQEWKWKKAEEYENFSTLDNVLNVSNRENKEGFIVHYVDTDVRVKYKHAEYLNVHRIATGITSKTIWRKLRQGENMDEWKQNIPEEFLDFINTRQNNLQARYTGEVNRLQEVHAAFKRTLPAGASRKDFAVSLNTGDFVSREDRPFIMQIENTGNPASGPVQAGRLWDRVKPDEETSFWNM